MTIKTFATVQASNGISLTKEKGVSVSLDHKNEKQYKLDGVYNIEAGLPEMYASHVKKHVDEVASGLNASIVSLTQNISENDTLFSGSSGLLYLSLKDLFNLAEKLVSKTEFLIVVSMLQVNRDNQCTDLVSPHGRAVTIKHHSKHGIYVEGLSQVVCSSSADALRLFDDGCQAANALKLQSYLASFTIRLFQRPVGTNGSSSVTCFKFINFHADKKNLSSISSFLSSIAKNKGKMGKSDKQKPVYEEILMDALLENNNATLLANVGGQDLENANSVLSTVEALSGVGTAPKVIRDDNNMTMHQLRQEISKVRDRLASQSPPKKADISLMEKLMCDLEETKRSGWDQAILRSEQFYEERKNSFSNKGLLWILESNKPANREALKKLQKLKEKLSDEYKTQRQLAESLSNDLKQKIENYTQFMNTDQSTSSAEKKAHVAAISELRDHHRRENDKLKEIKDKLSNTQEKLRSEQQSGVEGPYTFDAEFQVLVAERDRTQQEHQQMIEDELEKLKLEVAQEQADLQMKFSSKTLIKSDDDVLKHEAELVQLKSEKSVMTMQLDLLKRERVQLEEHMRRLAEKHSRELEIQQLQNLQTFRAYREVFEEFKTELENRWRGLLDDAIQDAVFLNARNSDLMESNAKLKFEVAKLKDDRSIKA